MKPKRLDKISEALRSALRHIKREGLQDGKIRERYAEYLVACHLSKQGHAVEVLGERKKTTADIYLPDAKRRVEVKSGCIDNDGWTDASFSLGKQIAGGKFDYCVFLTFTPNHEDPHDIFVFTREELKEVGVKRRGVADHEDTNPCLLLCAPSLKEYNAYIRAGRLKAFKIERELCRSPKQFRNAWRKIK